MGTMFDHFKNSICTKCHTDVGVSVLAPFCTYGILMIGERGGSTVNKIYIAIDLKSFFASVECVERGLDPLKTHLVVADDRKTEKTICLAITPSLKKVGLSGRARLFEVVAAVDRHNKQRLKNNHYKAFEGASCDEDELASNPKLKLDYIVAPPQMSHYMDWSTKIHRIYLKYIAPEDMHVYSIDEVFLDVTSYLKTYHKTPKELAMMIIQDILEATGITATAGIGTNLYLCKVAMDIVAKHKKADRNGVRIAALDEARYRTYLWHHQPLTDFWRVGPGMMKRLHEVGLYTMGDIAKCSVGDPHEFYNEDLLYEMFGVGAELLIDHAWGYESCEMKDIKAYKPETHSIGRGQVLTRPYSYEETRIIIKEMVELLALDLVMAKMSTKEVHITIGYDKDNIGFNGEYMQDRYGRKLPKQTQGRIHLPFYTSASSVMMEACDRWFLEHGQRDLMVRRLNVTAAKIKDEALVEQQECFEQLSLFDTGTKKTIKRDKEALDKEQKLMQATLKIKSKYGKNAILKGLNLEEGATTIERNETIGGHKA